jgi:hypothetical protein
MPRPAAAAFCLENQADTWRLSLRHKKRGRQMSKDAGPGSSNRTMIYVSAIVVVVVLAGLIYYATKPSGTPEGAQPAATTEQTTPAAPAAQAPAPADNAAAPAAAPAAPDATAPAANPAPAAPADNSGTQPAPAAQ